MFVIATGRPDNGYKDNYGHLFPELPERTRLSPPAANLILLDRLLPRPACDPAIPSVNKAPVMQLARCERIERRENVIAWATEAPARPTSPWRDAG